MTELATFRPDPASPVQLDGTRRDFILPICLPDPALQVGEALAVLVATTAEGQRVGVPIEVNAQKHLQGIVAEGMRVLQAGDEAP